MIRKLFAGISIAILICIATEWLLRVLVGPPPPAIQVHSSIGPIQQWLTKQGSQIIPTFTSVHFSAKRHGPRLAFLGGSSVHGGTPSIGFSQEFPALVGRKLQVTSLNLGHPGIDSYDLRKLTEQLRHYQFDAWIVYSGHNDFGNLYFFKRFYNWKASREAQVHAFLSQFQCYFQVRRFMLPHANRLRKGLNKDEHRHETVSMQQKQWAMRLLQDNVRRIAWLAEQSNTPLLWVLPAASLQQTPVENCTPAATSCIRQDFQRARQLQHRDPKLAATKLQEISDRDGIPLRIPSWARLELKQLAQDLNIAVLDAHQQLPQDPVLRIPAANLFHDHVHFSKQGHRAVAEMIAPYLQEQGFIAAPTE